MFGMSRISPELFGGLLIVAAMAILGLSDNLFYYLEPHMGLGSFMPHVAFLLCY